MCGQETTTLYCAEKKEDIIKLCLTCFKHQEKPQLGKDFNIGID